MFSDFGYLTLKCLHTADSTFAVDCTDNLVTVAISRTMDNIPESFQKFVGEQLVLDELQKWQSLGSDRYAADIEIAVKDKPVKITGTFLLEALGSGTQLIVDATVHVAIPLFGGMAEGFIRDHMHELLSEEYSIGLEWLAQNS